MNLITFYIYLSSELAEKTTKEKANDIKTFLQQSLGNKLILNGLEKYEEFGFITETTFKDKKYTILVGPEYGGGKSKWIVAPNPPHIPFLKKLFGIRGKDRVKQYQQLTSLIENALSQIKEIKKVEPYKEIMRV